MDPNTSLTCHDRAVALLRETDPDLALTVAAVAPSEDGEVLVGLLGWLPRPERLRLCRAVWLAHPPDAPCGWTPGEPYVLARTIHHGAWRAPASSEHRARRDAAIEVWTDLGHPAPRLD